LKEIFFRPAYGVVIEKVNVIYIVEQKYKASICIKYAIEAFLMLRKFKNPGLWIKGMVSASSSSA
jgi:hypothetical protein